MGRGDACLPVASIRTGAALARRGGCGGPERYQQIVSEAELAEPPPEQKAGWGRPQGKRI